MKIRRRTPHQKIDWEKAHARLARIRAGVDGALCLSPKRANEIMAERARALARVTAQAPLASEVLEVMTFSLGNERYGIETRHAREVVRITDLTPVPGVPDFLTGIINLRGEVLAVIDLGKFFGVAERGLTELSRVIVLGRERAEFGILADAVHDVTPLRVDEVLEPPECVAGVGREYLRGVTTEALIVLDGSVLLRDPRLFIDQHEEASK
jgi:chemotaxis signal transduction protein